MYRYHIKKIMLRVSSSACRVTYIKIHSAHLEPTFSSCPTKTFKYHLCSATKDTIWPIEITQTVHNTVGLTFLQLSAM